VVRMVLGVMELPVDVLIGWQDIIHKGFWSLLCALGKSPVKTSGNSLMRTCNWGDTGANLPVASPPRRQSGAVRMFTEESVQKLLDAGFIVPSKSPTASLVVVVRAADKDWRFCVDYGRINNISESNPFPLPNLVGVLERLAGHKFYAKFDLRRGYHQLLVDPRDRHLTAFVCESEFGLMNAPAFFQRQMSTAVLA
jgi:hypothetical protein